MAIEPSENGTVISQRKLRWSVAAAFIVGVATVLLFFIFFGIPSGFESYAHRNDEAWQERNNPTTTTEVWVGPPLTDAFRSEFQGKLEEAVKQLGLWEASWRSRWESLTPEMQCTYNPGAAGYDDSVVPSVVDCVQRFSELAHLWSGPYESGVFNGDEVDFWDLTLRRSPTSHTVRHWEGVFVQAKELLHAMGAELGMIDRSLLWTTITQEYRMTEADRAFILSWYNTRDDIEWPLHDAESDLDLAYAEWYLAKDKAERPERYIGSD